MKLNTFISGFVRRKEWSNKDQIAAIKLSVLLKASDGTFKKYHIATVDDLPDVLRKDMSRVRKMIHCELRPTYYSKVLTLESVGDKFKFDSKGQLITNAAVNWAAGFNEDVIAEECVLLENFRDHPGWQ